MENIEFSEKHVGLRVNCIVKNQKGEIIKYSPSSLFPVHVKFDNGEEKHYRRKGNMFPHGRRVLLIGDDSTIAIKEEKLPKESIVCPFCNAIHEPAHIMPGVWAFATLEDCPLHEVTALSEEKLNGVMSAISKGVDNTIETARAFFVHGIPTQAEEVPVPETAYEHDQMYPGDSGTRTLKERS